MELEQLPLRLRRALALAILAGGLVGAYLVFIMPLLLMADGYAAQIDRLNKHLVSARQILGEGKTASERLRQVALAEKRNGYYLESDRPTLAAAELQRRVKQTIEQQGGSIVSSQVLGERENDGLHMVVLRVNMRMDLPVFERILHALETQPPVLLLDNITIVARPSGTTARWRGGAERQDLDTSFDVMGYLKVVKDSDV